MEESLQPLVHTVRAEVGVGHGPVHAALLGRGDPALPPAQRAAGAVHLGHLGWRRGHVLTARRV